MAVFFQGLINYLEQFAKLNIDKLALDIARMSEHDRLVIKLNTQNQLFDKGINSEGQTLASVGGSYSPLTVSIKQSKGQPTNRVTLKDTGEFYLSFRTTPFRGGFRIEADPIKDDTNLFDEWGANIVGLTKESLDILTEFYLIEINKKLDVLVNNTKIL